MCGIAGAVGISDAYRLTLEMLRLLSHRGPDGVGVKDHDGSAIGMCRLQIRGHAPHALPMWDVSTKSWLSYNGEVYQARSSFNPSIPNDPISELDHVLRARTGCNSIDGMYALAVLSKDGNFVELMRDPFGIKPLFWRKLPKGYLFASELFPLIRVHNDSLNFNKAAIWEFLAFGRVLGSHTFYSNVWSVPPGGAVQFEDGSFRVIGQLTLKEMEELVEIQDLRCALRNTVKRCLISDRPIGLALSGGFDSTFLAFELNALGIENIDTVSVIIPGVCDGVTDLGELGLSPGGPWTTWRHHTTTFQASDLPSVMESASFILGQPTKLSSIPLYLSLARATKEAGVVVLLTGEGSDELFAGYRSYLWWRDHLLQLKGIDQLAEFAFPAARREWLKILLGDEAVQWCHTRFKETYAELANDAPFQALRRLERTISLEPLLLRLDHCLMRFGIEGRTPYLHGSVPRIANLIPAESLLVGKETKFALRMLLCKDLPSGRAWSRKQAFRAPLSSWFTDYLSDWLQSQILTSLEDLADMGFKTPGLERLVAKTLTGDDEAAALSYGIVSLVAWKRCFFDNTVPVISNQPTSFGTVVGAYSIYRPKYPKQLFQEIVSFVTYRRQTAIDLGAGTGLSSQPLLPWFTRVIAVEPDRAMASSLKENEKNLMILPQKAEELEQPYGTVDLVTAGNAFYWMDGPLVAARVERWLRHGGIFAVYRYGFPVVKHHVQELILEELKDKWDPFRHPRLLDEEYSLRTIQSVKHFHVKLFEIPNIVLLDTREFLGFLTSTSYVSAYLRTLSQPNGYVSQLRTRISKAVRREKFEVDFRLELIIAEKKQTHRPISAPS